MTISMRRLAVAGMLALCCLEAAAQVTEKLADPSTIREMQKGGLVLFLRHGATDNSRSDQLPISLSNCQSQRMLNDQGRQMAREIGEALRKAGVPVAEIIHSPLCRARESAELAFPGASLREDLGLLYTAKMSDEEKQKMAAATRGLLGGAVPNGSNRVIVGHAPNLAEALDYAPRSEGTMVVVRPTTDGQFAYVATINPDMWSKLQP